MPPPRLSIIGLGVKIPDHVTAEARQAMAGCTRIYSIVQEPPSLWLPAANPRQAQVINLLDFYAEGALRTENYDRVAEIVFDSLAETEHAGYVTYGNPFAYDSVAQRLVDRARQVRIAFQVIPGISSVDTLLCDLGTDMAPGIQIYDASWLVAAGLRLEPATQAMLLQIGAFGSLRAHYKTRPQGRSLVDLSAYLEKFYPPSHRIYLIRSSGGAQDPRNIAATELGELPGVAAEHLLNCSMYLPPVQPARLDEHLIAAMQQE
jgi:uncharacterized protein YabN with tetrapyrrole methylase and pyrophosphatase domain